MLRTRRIFDPSCADEALAEMRQRVGSGQACGYETVVLRSALSRSEWHLQRDTDFDRVSDPKAMHALQKRYVQTFPQLSDRPFSCPQAMAAHMALALIKMRARSIGNLDVTSVSQFSVKLDNPDDGRTSLHVHDVMSVILYEPMADNERLAWAMEALLYDNCRDDVERRTNCAMCQPYIHLPWPQAKIARFHHIERRIRLLWPEGVDWDVRHVNLCVQSLCRLARQMACPFSAAGPHGAAILAEAEAFMRRYHTRLSAACAKDASIKETVDRLRVELALTLTELMVGNSLFTGAPLAKNLMGDIRDCLSAMDCPPPHMWLQMLANVMDAEAYDPLPMVLPANARTDEMLVFNAARGEMLLISYRAMVRKFQGADTLPMDDVETMSRCTVAAGTHFGAAVAVNRGLSEPARRCIIDPAIRLQLLQLETQLLQGVTDRNRAELASKVMDHVTLLGTVFSGLILEPCWTSDVFGASIDVALVAARCAVLMSFLQTSFSEHATMMAVVKVVVVHCQRLFDMCGYTFDVAKASRMLKTIVCSLISV